MKGQAKSECERCGKRRSLQHCTWPDCPKGQDICRQCRVALIESLRRKAAAK